MSVPHHSDAELQKRFLDQVNARAKRNYSSGRLGADDDGDLAIAVVADTRHQVVRIDFGKPVEWVALDIPAIERLETMLMEKRLELRGIKP